MQDEAGCEQNAVECWNLFQPCPRDLSRREPWHPPRLATRLGATSRLSDGWNKFQHSTALPRYIAVRTGLRKAPLQFPRPGIPSF